jgi:dihydrofolate reductase
MKIISAVSQNNVIGKDNKLPWNYPEDLKHFKETTLNSTIIMGRKTFESIGKPLPKRNNVVISKSNIYISGVTIFSSLDTAINTLNKSYPTFCIGGASIYEEALKLNCVEEIILTMIPEIIEGENLVKFPYIDPLKFSIKEKKKISNLDLFIYEKI